jgi:hypothetical protein
MFKGLLGKLKENFTDDEGMFQGGAEGRAGGRARDFLNSDVENEGMGDPNSQGQSGYKQDHARNMAKNFNPGDPQSVLKMQQWLNEAGYSDDDGNELSTDGQMGGKTLSALRKMQGEGNANTVDTRDPGQGGYPLDPERTAGPYARGESPFQQENEEKPSFVRSMMQGWRN